VRNFRPLLACSILALALLAGCSGSDSNVSASASTIATSTTSADPCRAGYQAAASKLNSSARYFSQAAQNGKMNEQFARFAADYLQAMKTFDETVVALPCTGAVKEDLAQLVASQAGLEPLVAQFAAGIQPPVAEFNAAASKVAEAVKRVNAAFGIG